MSQAELPRDVSKLRGWVRSRTVVRPGSKLPTRRITINIDRDVIAIFKAEALQGGLPIRWQ